MKTLTAASLFPDSEESGAINSSVWKDDAIKQAIEFAKHHVKAALIKASKIHYAPHYDLTSKENDELEKDMCNSILNSYNLNNIK